MLGFNSISLETMTMPKYSVSILQNQWNNTSCYLWLFVVKPLIRALERMIKIGLGLLDAHLVGKANFMILISWVVLASISSLLHE